MKNREKHKKEIKQKPNPPNNASHYELKDKTAPAPFVAASAGVLRSPPAPMSLSLVVKC